MSNMIVFEIFQYLLIAVLTFIFSSYIIKRSSRIRSSGIKTAMRSQSEVFNKTKHLIPNDLKNKQHVSQSQNHANQFMLKVMVIDNRAYWVKDNTFFTADIKNGNVLQETTRQVDTLNMSKQDLDKMIFILDKLKDDK